MYCYQCAVTGCCDSSGTCSHSTTFCEWSKTYDEVYQNKSSAIAFAVTGSIFGFITLVVVIWMCKKRYQQNNTPNTTGYENNNGTTTIIMPNNQPAFGQNMYPSQQTGIYPTQPIIYPPQPIIYPTQPIIYPTQPNPTYNQPVIIDPYQSQPYYNAPGYYQNQGPIIIQS